MIKAILSVLLALPVISFAQDTCKLKKETDPFTHITKLTTGFIPFQAEGVDLAISIDGTPTDIDFFLWIKNDEKCFDDQSTIQVIYEGERMKANYRNTGSMNCEGAFHFTFKNSATTPSNLLRLTDKKVSAFKLTNGKIVTEIKFSEEQRQQLMRMAGCVVRESKSLLKK